jgi:hypothetical protein
MNTNELQSDERRRERCAGKILIPGSLMTMTMITYMRSTVVRITGKDAVQISFKPRETLLELVRSCLPAALVLTAPLFRTVLRTESRIADHFGRVLVLPDHETGPDQILAAGAHVLDRNARNLFVTEARP